MNYVTNIVRLKYFTFLKQMRVEMLKYECYRKIIKITQFEYVILNYKLFDTRKK